MYNTLQCRLESKILPSDTVLQPLDPIYIPAEILSSTNTGGYNMAINLPYTPWRAALIEEYHAKIHLEAQRRAQQEWQAHMEILAMQAQAHQMALARQYEEHQAKMLLLQQSAAMDTSHTKLDGVQISNNDVGASETQNEDQQSAEFQYAHPSYEASADHQTSGCQLGGDQPRTHHLYHAFDLHNTQQTEYASHDGNAEMELGHSFDSGSLEQGEIRSISDAGDLGDAGDIDQWRDGEYGDDADAVTVSHHHHDGGQDSGNEYENPDSMYAGGITTCPPPFGF
eukprot:TRINITY_DN3590_c1_g1_i8.p1 TRINITY_DN3590_c1_g1~~TRINITY_DN3590_c1_g1_i8.p1  ORF type:complete len:300 (+),score=72.63 TRINITY_DN3590_c1_g1_i8:54-902(+)